MDKIKILEDHCRATLDGSINMGSHWKDYDFREGYLESEHSKNELWGILKRKNDPRSELARWFHFVLGKVPEYALIKQSGMSSLNLPFVDLTWTCPNGIYYRSEIKSHTVSNAGKDLAGYLTGNAHNLKKHNIEFLITFDYPWPKGMKRIDDWPKEVLIRKWMPEIKLSIKKVEFLSKYI